MVPGAQNGHSEPFWLQVLRMGPSPHCIQGKWEPLRSIWDPFVSIWELIWSDPMCSNVLKRAIYAQYGPSQSLQGGLYRAPPQPI